MKQTCKACRWGTEAPDMGNIVYCEWMQNNYYPSWMDEGIEVRYPSTEKVNADQCDTWAPTGLMRKI
jgi:predicted aldo/keto reductase-like oxidoreductase